MNLYRQPFLKSSDVGRSLLATVRQLQIQRVMAEIDQGFENWPVPTLIVWGTADKWLPENLADRFARKLTDSEVVKLAETGHYA